eukprot:2136165-Rhodomonas_salina.1
MEEVRWNLPRGLAYCDLHCNATTAPYCDIVIPDCLPRSLWADVDWAGIYAAGYQTGNWTEFRERRRAFVLEMRRTMLGAQPKQRIYVRLTEPH